MNKPTYEQLEEDIENLKYDLEKYQLEDPDYQHTYYCDDRLSFLVDEILHAAIGHGNSYQFIQDHTYRTIQVYVEEQLKGQLQTDKADK